MSFSSDRCDSWGAGVRSWLAVSLLLVALPVAAPTRRAASGPANGGTSGPHESREQAAGALLGLSLAPSLWVTYPGAAFAIEVVADCGDHADGVATLVAFDPAYVQVEAITPDASVFPHALRKQYDNGAGLVRYDAGAPLECHMDGNCPSGTAHVATITFRTVGGSDSSVLLSLQGQMSWEGAYTFDAEGSGGTVIISIAGDLDGDCDVDIVDIMLVASRWSSRLGQPQYDARYDLDADGDIDIVDIMVVAARWQKTCSNGLAVVEGNH